MKIEPGMSAIVTGAASGLGLAVAKHLSASGVKVALFDLSKEAGEAEAKALGGIFCKVDVTDPEAVEKGLARARAAHGQERICVNCAGIAPAASTVGRKGAHDPSLFAKTICINLIGSFNVSSQSAAGMSGVDPVGPDEERGVIINTASVAAFDGQIGQVAYAASKAGVAGMTLPMARDLSRFGIRVVTVAPGIFGTPMLMAMPDDVKAALGASVPFPPRLGDPPEFAEFIGHIVATPLLNGETIRLDGAIRMPPK